MNRIFFPSSSDKKLNNRLAEKKKQEIPERALLPFVTRSVLPPENFQARLVVFPRRRSRGRAGGNHRLFLFQNWVRHDKKNEDFEFPLGFAFFFPSQKKKSFPFTKSFQTAPKRVTETSPRRATQKFAWENLPEKSYYGLMFAAKEFVIKLHN